MKAIVKFAVMGICALALNAHAAGVAQSEAEIIMKTPKGRAFMEKNLGISRADQFQAALSKLSSPEQAAILNAVNAFKSERAKSASTSAQADAILAQKIFAVNGQVRVIKIDSRASVSGSASAEVCSNDNYADVLAKKSGLSFTAAKDAVESGVLSKGNCHEGQGILAIQNPEAAANLIKLADCAKDRKVAALRGSAYDNALGTCLMEAKGETGTLAANVSAIKQLQDPKACGFIKAQ